MILYNNERPCPLGGQGRLTFSYFFFVCYFITILELDTSISSPVTLLMARIIG